MTRSWLYILLVGLLLFTVSASADAFRMDINTTSVTGPFWLQFDLIGGGTPGNNTVNMYLTGTPSSASLTDDFFQSSARFDFDAGTPNLSFLLNLTNNPDELFPDELAVYLFNGEFPISTTDPLGANALVVMDLGVDSKISPQVFDAVDAGAIASVSTPSVPEPATILFMGAILPLLALRRKRSVI